MSKVSTGSVSSLTKPPFDLIAKGKRPEYRFLNIYAGLRQDVSGGDMRRDVTFRFDLTHYRKVN